ncbi:hypothetical protein AQ611_05350 [Burkholderia singularis]|nr:hypothetical protein AQ611_05350 [Burkholderia sp. Bp7605]
MLRRAISVFFVMRFALSLPAAPTGGMPVFAGRPPGADRAESDDAASADCRLSERGERGRPFAGRLRAEVQP